MKNRWVVAGAALLIGVSGQAWSAEEVNLYSARKENLIKPLLDRFTEESGIEVNLVTGKADALLKRLEVEGRHSPADLLLTTDAGRLHRAKEAGVLQPMQSDALEQVIPDTYRDPEGYWYGLSVRARPILYVKDKVDPQELSTYEDLADPRWKNRVCIRSSSNIYNQSLVASMITSRGQEATQQWADTFVKNFARKPAGGDRDQIAAAAAGMCDIAVANTYYLGVMLHSDDPAQREEAEKVAVFWPNQEGRGTHVNVSGIALTAAAGNRDNAQRLMEFLVSDEAQAWYAEVNHEYPVKADVAWSETLQSWGSFKADDVNMAKLGEYNAEAVKLMDRAGWR
ncbi:Fe(3+) ABC transporter substrate-binding protein [Thiohalomonas denitrificans]|uniref:Iron(III) transport system substrate-binding protein n=1 Tax=Thiohalomonas denitrificans TaxID=415747 RepID=A0A1G5R2N5_9GAMM|nr:Fe(3+) ABC transporter substrate-binding protein [Thiohalomonas denitrificans]SCZ68343.1 iron(III) transport system substrate-binding protein [Thiohalomonas denitrificans]